MLLFQNIQFLIMAEAVASSIFFTKHAMLTHQRVAKRYYNEPLGQEANLFHSSRLSCKR